MRNRLRSQVRRGSFFYSSMAFVTILVSDFFFQNFQSLWADFCFWLRTKTSSGVRRRFNFMHRQTERQICLRLSVANWLNSAIRYPFSAWPVTDQSSAEDSCLAFFSLYERNSPDRTALFSAKLLSFFVFFVVYFSIYEKLKKILYLTNRRQ